MDADTAGPFIERMKASKHESVMEHGSITVRFVVDRGVSHELVRHRIASFSQESTRYCNYGKDKFGGELTFIEPLFFEHDSSEWASWHSICEFVEKEYLWMLDAGVTPQEARSILPNSLKTEVIVTANPREFRHIFRLRCDRASHPQMREVMLPLLFEFATRWPALYQDLLPANTNNIKQMERALTGSD
jgi:thymidylate synthase (FAD)